MLGKGQIPLPPWCVISFMDSPWLILMQKRTIMVYLFWIMTTLTIPMIAIWMVKWRTLLCLPWKYIIFKYVWSWALSKSGHYLIIYIVLKKNKGILKVYKLVLYQNTFCPFFYYYYTYIILSLYSNFKAAMIVVLN